MNARQKAKHFKRLYEESLPKRPYPVVYQSLPMLHYKAEYLAKDLIEPTEIIEKAVVDILLQKIRPIVQDNMQKELWGEYGYWKYSIDLWAPGKEKNEK